MSVQINTSQNVQLDYEPASIGERILANVIDYLIYLAWVILTAFLLKSMNGGGDSSQFFFYLIIILPILMYPLLSEYFLNGQTIGKRALSIKVVMLDGSKPTLGAYILRWILIIVDLGIFSQLIAVLTIAINGKGQRVGDIAAGTTVIRTEKRVSLGQVMYQQLPEDYRLKYPEASNLTDRDIETIRQVLRRRNDNLTFSTAERVRTVMNLNEVGDADLFLRTVINDYAYLALKEAQ